MSDPNIELIQSICWRICFVQYIHSFSFDIDHIICYLFYILPLADHLHILGYLSFQWKVFFIARLSKLQTKLRGPKKAAKQEIDKRLAIDDKKGRMLVAI